METETITLDRFMKNISKVPAIIKVRAEGHAICGLEGMRNIIRSTEDIELILEPDPRMIERARYRSEKLLEEVNQVFILQTANRGRPIT